MKKINLSITKCINTKCDFRIISEQTMKECPICHGKLVKEKDFRVEGYDQGNGFITLKKQQGKIHDNNR